MFEQTLIGRTRKAWTVPLSFAGQLVLVAAATIAPLVFFEPLSLARLSAPLTLPPVQRGGDPGPHVTLVPVPPTRKPHEFYAPARVPANAPDTVVDAPPEFATGPAADCLTGHCVSGPGLPNGVEGGLPLSDDQRVIVPPPPVETRPIVTSQTPVIRIKLGGRVQEGRLLSRVKPAYPPLAIRSRVSGVVVLHAIIGADGRIRELHVLSGHPWLVAAAAEAVRQWTYVPTHLNGDPVEVDTEITVRFDLLER